MNEIHRSFLSGLVFVAIITLIAMATSRIVVHRVLNNHENSPVYTIRESHPSHK